MKKQEVNLYKSLPRVSRNWFSDMVVFQVAAGFLALLVAITFVQMIMLAFNKHQTNSLQKKYIELNTTFMKEQKAQGGVDLIQLQQELASKKQLLSLLHIKSEEGGACPLLSDYFKSLSSVQVSGVWLTRIRVEPDTRNMTFTGQTYDPILIIEFIRQMGKTPCFSGVTFHTISIEKSSDVNAKTMDFTVTSVTTPPPKPGAK